MLDFAPIALTPDQRAEAREIATASGWHALCREHRCRDWRACVGRVRRFAEGGPRCYPACINRALGAMAEPRSIDAETEEVLAAMLDHDEARDGPAGAPGPGRRGREREVVAPGPFLLGLLFLAAGPRGGPPLPAGRGTPGPTAAPT